MQQIDGTYTLKLQQKCPRYMCDGRLNPYLEDELKCTLCETTFSKTAKYIID